MLFQCNRCEEAEEYEPEDAEDDPDLMDGEVEFWCHVCNDFRLFTALE